MKLLTSRQDTIFDTQTTSTREISRLQSELKEWKQRYSQLRLQFHSQGSTSTTTSNGTSLNSPLRIDVKSRLVTTEDGVIEETTILRFQNSIDELLITARRDDAECLEYMTEVIKATRAIADDIKRNAQQLATDDPTVRKLTQRLSATANNLITATKNHVSSQGISPLSLLDAAASHLTTTVVELTKLVKVRPSAYQPGDEDIHSERSRYSELATPLTSPLSPTKPTPAPLKLRNKPSLQDATLPDSPRSIDSHRSSAPGGLISQEDEELRVYLDNQTQAIVESIQSLLGRIRNTKLDKIENFRGEIGEIVGIVSGIIDVCENKGGVATGVRADSRITGILKGLDECCEGMKTVSQTPEDGFKKRLARIAFDISKQIKVQLPPISKSSFSFEPMINVNRN
jgi:G protein-coupled receptor kinase-interacting protein 1 C term